MPKKRKNYVSIIILIITFPLLGLPYYMTFIGALKPNTAMYEVPPNLWPTSLSLFNFEYVVQKQHVLLPLFNSSLVAVMTSLITVLVSATAGYVFAKKYVIGKKYLFSIIIASMIMPRQVLMIPVFLVVKKLNLLDSLWGVILSSISAPFGIFLMKQFISTIPDELLEAARIDGCSEGRTFISIVLRMSLPAIGALSIFTLIMTWNDFLWQFVLISKKTLQTIPIAISTMAEKFDANIGYQLAGAAIATGPILMIFILCQKFFIKGITVGALKG